MTVADLVQITNDYNANMAALEAVVLSSLNTFFFCFSVCLTFFLLFAF